MISSRDLIGQRWPSKTCSGASPISS